MQWQVQEAKQRFSEVLRAAETGEVQVVTRHGQAVAVVLDIESYHQLTGETMSFGEFLLSGPKADVELELPSRGDDDSRPPVEFDA
jgi:prevent-host-death family protein